MIRILMDTGSLEWNLADQAVHQAGGVLEVTCRITNPTPLARSYRIYMALYDPETGNALAGSTGAISLDDIDTFEVADESQLDILVPLQIEYSNVLLRGSLYDVGSGEMATGLQCLLVPPPGMEEQIASVSSFTSGVITMGLVSELVGEMITGMISGIGGA